MSALPVLIIQIQNIRASWVPSNSRSMNSTKSLQISHGQNTVEKTLPKALAEDVKNKKQNA